MSPSLVGIIITAILGLLLLTSVLFGIKRGLKKTLFRGAWIIVTFVLAFVFTPVISNWLNGFDISSYGLDVYGPVTKLSDIGANIVNSLAGGEEVIADNPALQSFAQNLPTMLINIFLFVILFWLLKALLYPLWAMFSSMMFDKQKRQQKKFKKQQAKLQKQNNGIMPPQDDTMPIILQVKPKQTRIGGAIVGFVIGLLLCMISFTPIVGLNSIYQNVYANVQVEKDGKKVSLIEDSIEDKQMLEYLSCYENSIASKIITYSGMGFISNAMFDGLASVNVNNETVYLSQEVETVVKVYNKYESIKGFSTENMTQESLDKMLTAIKEVFIEAKDSKIVYLLGNDLIPYFLDDIIKDPEFELIDGAEIDDLIVSVYDEIAESLNLKSLQNQLESLVDVIVMLNNSNLIVPFVNGEVESFEQVVDLVATNIKTPNNFSKTIVDSLYNVSILKDKYADFLDSTIESVFTSLDITYSEQSLNVSNAQLKQDLKTIIYNAIEFMKLYNNSENLDFGESTTDALRYLGQILDIVQEDILFAENYNNLIDYATEELNANLAEVADFSTITENLKDIKKDSQGNGGWQDELYALTSLYKSIVKLINDGVTFEKVLDEEYVLFENIGDGLRSAILGSSKIVSNETIREAIEIILDNIDTSSFDEVLNVVVSGTSTLKETILNNIYDETKHTSLIGNKWNDELKYNLAVFRAVYKINEDNFDLDALSATNNNQLKNLGAAIDDAIDKTKLILTNEVISNILDYYLDKVNFGSEVDEILSLVYKVQNEEDVTVYDQILYNIVYDNRGYPQNLSWENEFLKIKGILKANFETSELTEIGQILDSLSGSKIISKEVVNKVVEKYIDDEAESLPEGVEKAIAAMKRNLVDVISYETEFGFVDELLKTLNGYYENDRTKFEAFGNKFNRITNIQGTELIISKLFTKQVVNEFIIYYFDDYMDNNLDATADSDLIAIVDSIKSNLNAVTNYKNELLNILDLVECVADEIPDKNSDSVSDLKDIGYVLDRMNSNIISTGVIRDLINYYVDKESDTIDDAKLTAIIEKIKTNIADEAINVTSYEIEFGYLNELTKLITEETLNYSNIGQLFDEICNSAGSETAIPSVFMGKTILNDMICYYFDKFTEEKLSSADDAALRTIVNGIKTNTNKITSYKTELENLEKLFNVVNSTSNAEIGKKLDEIKTTSKLIATENIAEIVGYFFDEKAGDYATDEEFKTVVGLMRTKITSSSVTSYETMFTELDTIISYVADFDNVSVEEFTNPGPVGEKLDEMEDMTQACDKNITYEFAKVILQKLSSTTVIREAINVAFYNTESQDYSADFDFANYNSVNHNGQYQGTSYYKDLMIAVQTVITTVD